MTSKQQKKISENCVNFKILFWRWIFSQKIWIWEGVRKGFGSRLTAKLQIPQTKLPPNSELFWLKIHPLEVPVDQSGWGLVLLNAGDVLFKVIPTIFLSTFYQRLGAKILPQFSWFFFFFSAFLHEKCWNKLVFAVCSTQTLVKIYNSGQLTFRPSQEPLSTAKITTFPVMNVSW